MSAFLGVVALFAFALAMPHMVPLATSSQIWECEENGFCADSSWISACWLCAGLVWIATVVHALVMLPFSAVLRVVAPAFGPLSQTLVTFATVQEQLMPQDLHVCVVYYAYGFALWVALVYAYFGVAVPLTFWLWLRIDGDGAKKRE